MTRPKSHSITEAEVARLGDWLVGGAPSLDSLMQTVMVLRRHDRLRQRARWLHENMDEYLAAHLPSQRPISWRAP